jgi:hypothetical protein
MGEEPCPHHTPLCGRGKVRSLRLRVARLKWLLCKVGTSSLLSYEPSALTFVHSLRMLKARITLWKLDKKVKWKDMCTAAQMIALRATDLPVEHTKFRIRRRIVTWKELVAYFRRRKIHDPIEWTQTRPMDASQFSSDVILLTPRTSVTGSDDEFEDTEITDRNEEYNPTNLHIVPEGHSGPAMEEVSCDVYQMSEEMALSNAIAMAAVSPKQRPSTPFTFRRADDILWHMRNYCDGYIESIWDLKHSEPLVHHQTTHGLFGHRVQDGVSFILQGKVDLGFKSLDGAFGLITELLHDHHPMALAQVITVICELVARDMIPLVRQLLIHIRDMSTISRRAVFPMTAIFEVLLHADGDIVHLLLSAMRIAVDTFKSAGGISRWKLLYLEERLCDCLYHVGDQNERIGRRLNLLRAQQEHYGQDARNVLWTLSNVADDHLLRGNLGEAEVIFRDLLSRADRHEGFGRAKNRFAALEGLSKAAIATAERGIESELGKGHIPLSELSQIKLREACDWLFEAETVAAAWFDVSSRRTLRVHAKLAEIHARAFQFDT